LHLAPKVENGHVLVQEVELGPRRRWDRSRPCQSGQTRKALEGTLVELMLWLLVVFAMSEVQFVGGQQLREPLQFPERPLAPLACR
jgi:hypothetical protein